MRSGKARTFIRSRSRLAMPPSTISASSRPSSIDRHERIAPGRSLANAWSQRSQTCCSPEPAELLRNDLRGDALAGERRTELAERCDELPRLLAEGLDERMRSRRG